MKEKNLIFIIVIVCISALLGVLVYNNINKNNKDDINKETSIQDERNNYELYVINKKYAISKLNEDTIRTVVKNDFYNIEYVVSLNSKFELYINYSNEELNKKYGNYKIADNVIDYYIVSGGNAGYKYLYFVKDDGTVGRANVEFGVENEMVITNDLIYKNIVSIKEALASGESGYSYAIFVDIDGNIYK